MADEKLINGLQRYDVKVTDCKTVTNTQLTRDRHGVTRHEVAREVKRGK